MFTWICPKCGREVPPSYNECPECAAKQAQPEAAPAAPVPPAAAPPAAQAAPAAAPKPRSALHALVVTVLVAAALIGAGAAAYKYLLPGARSAAPVPPSTPPVESVSAAPAAGVKQHPLAKYIEITGFRILEDARQRAQIKYLVVNHSAAEMPELGMVITLRLAGAKPDQPPVASFDSKVSSLAPWEAKELTSMVKSQLRAYELPDWQFLRPEFEITSPQP